MYFTESCSGGGGRYSTLSCVLLLYVSCILQSRVLVVGAGIAGLAAARHLTNLGIKVTLCHSLYLCVKPYKFDLIYFTLVLKLSFVLPINIL